MILYFVTVTTLLVLSLILQDLLPVFEALANARVFIVSSFFLCASVTVSYPVMLLWAFLVGVLWDAGHMPALGTGTELNPGNDLPMGYSVFLFALMGSLMQGVRPLFQRRQWLLPMLMAMLATVILLFLEYIVLTLRRGDPQFPMEVLRKIVYTGLVTAPSVILFGILLLKIADLTRYNAVASPMERRWQ